MPLQLLLLDVAPWLTKYCPLQLLLSRRLQHQAGPSGACQP